MRGPKPAAIALSDAERQGLEALLRRHSTPQQLVLRARIVLAAAAGRNNAQIVRDLAVDIGTARRWRGRWLGLQAVGLAELSVEERLTDAPRSGKPAGDHRRADLPDRRAGLRGPERVGPPDQPVDRAARSPTRSSRAASCRPSRRATPRGCAKGGAPAPPASAPG